MNFLFDEDEALRNLLLGMSVTDQKDTTRAVKVYFGQPDQELRDQTYPYITIDMIDINEATDRAMRGKAKPSYLSDPVTGPNGTSNYNSTTQNWNINWPIPVNIDYQITTYARQPRHDREILAQILYTKIPMRFAVLEPADGTVRRLDLLDIAKRDITEQGKRLFVNAFTVRVSSEIAPETYDKLYKALTIAVTGTAGTITHGKGQFTPLPSFTITHS